MTKEELIALFSSENKDEAIEKIFSELSKSTNPPQPAPNPPTPAPNPKPPAPASDTKSDTKLTMTMSEFIQMAKDMIPKQEPKKEEGDEDDGEIYL